MSAIDWPAMLAQLEQQRTALEQERQDIDAVIETVRRRAGVVVPTGLTLPPARSAKPARNSGANGKNQKITDAQLAAMRTRWELGESAVAIAKRVKVSNATVYARAKAGGWKRPKMAAPKTEPKGTLLSGSVRCDHCQTMTDYDPCRACGKTLTRKW